MLWYITKLQIIAKTAIVWLGIRELMPQKLCEFLIKKLDLQNV